MFPWAPGCYACEVDLPASALAVRVEAEDDLGRLAFEGVEMARDAHLDLERRADGSDADPIGAWDERGVLATRLGLNGNGEKW